MIFLTISSAFVSLIGLCPNSLTKYSAVSAANAWFIVTVTPIPRFCFITFLDFYAILFSIALTVFASGKDGIFNAGTPIGKTQNNGEVELFVDPNQLSFVTVNLIKPTNE